MTAMNTPKPIKVGPVYDTDGTTPIQSAKIYAYNGTNAEFSTEIGTTDSSGTTVMDLGNFPSGYTNGDVVQFMVQETATSYIEGQDVVDKIARDLIKQVKKNIATYSNTKNKLFYGNLLANTRDPYDEIHKLFKRRVEINLKAINVGET